MDELCSSNALPPFIAKIYEMVDDSSTNSIVSWSQSNRSFIVWDSLEFARDLLPKYFKHSNFSSFIRQLNTYGFRKIDPEQWEFANDDFVRGQPHLLKNIHRRKPVHSHSGQGSSQSPLAEIERQGYKDDIERLKSEKESLHLELYRHKQEQEALELQLKSMTEHVKLVEQHHKSMISILARALQKPMAALDLMGQSDKHDKKRRLPGNNRLSNEISMEDNHIDSSQKLSKEDLNVTSLLAFNKDILDQLEASLSLWENILLDIRQTYGRHNSSLGLDKSTSRAESPAVSYTQLNDDQYVDVRPKTSGIDMNREPNTIAVTENGDLQERGAANPRNAPTGVNDVFWEQFLTENPGSTDASEVQSERKDADCRKNETKPVDPAKFWWNSKSLNNHREQLGHLAPAERT